MKHFGLLLTLFFISFLCHGQLEIGIQAGYGVPTFIPDNSGPSEINYSGVHDNFIISIGARERSKKTFNLGMDLTYTNQSFKAKASSGGLGGSSFQNVAINYGDLNLDILPQFVYGKKIKIFISPGFFFGTTLHSSCTGTLALLFPLYFYFY
jgi:hypothetical protein